MTRVTDEDLEWLAGYCDGDSAKAARIVREVRGELLALRNVAEAAVNMRDDEDGDQWNKSQELFVALREAGL